MNSDKRVASVIKGPSSVLAVCEDIREVISLKALIGQGANEVTLASGCQKCGSESLRARPGVT